MNSIIDNVFSRLSIVMMTCLMMHSNVDAYVVGNKLSKTAGQSNIAYSQDNRGSYQFAYEVTDKGGATNFRQETGGPKAVKGSYGLTDVDGRTRLVNYQADKFGFVASVDSNEPGTGREDSADVAYNGPDKGKGWAYAVAITENQSPKNKYDQSTYQSYSYSNSLNDNKFNSKPQPKDEEQFNEKTTFEKNYDRREEYKNPIESTKPVSSSKSKETTDIQEPVSSKKGEQIKNVNYEAGGHFDTSNVPASLNSETDKNYDQAKAQQEDNSENMDDKSEEEPHISEPYEKRQMHLMNHPKPDRSDYVVTIDKLAKKEKIKSSSPSFANKKSSASNIIESVQSDKVISQLINMSSEIDDDK